MWRRRVAAAVAGAVALLALVQLVGVVRHDADGGERSGAGVAAVPGLVRASRPVPRTPDAYRGLGAWVDRYDSVPGGALSPAEAVAAMADDGVRTLYLQATVDDGGGAPGVTDPELLARYLVHAHRAGIRVVAWHLPLFDDVDRDLAHLRAIDRFEVLGHRVDGIALDIEWTEAVADHGDRSARLVELSTRLRSEVGGDALGAVVLPPVLLEEVNTDYWPRFPWDELAPLYDAWLPMGYWTQRTDASGHREAGAYTAANLRRLQDHLGEDVTTHAIGGLAEDTGAEELAAFVAAARDEGAVGASLYDWATTSPEMRREMADLTGAG